MDHGTHPRRSPLAWLCVDAVLAVAFTLAVVAMLVDPHWIESLTGFEPDGGNEALEWAIVGALATGLVGSVIGAGRQWRRVRALPA